MYRAQSRVSGAIDLVFADLSKTAADFLAQPPTTRIPRIQDVPVWVSVHGADGLVEGWCLCDCPCEACLKQNSDFGGGQAVNTGEQVVRGIVEEP